MQRLSSTEKAETLLGNYNATAAAAAAAAQQLIDTPFALRPLARSSYCTSGCETLLIKKSACAAREGKRRL